MKHDLSQSEGPALRDAIPPPQQARFRSRELRLLLACTRWPQLPSDRDEIRSLLREELDADRVLALALHHRLVPLVAHTLSAAAQDDLPNAIQSLLDQLRQSAAANTYRGLRSLAEMRRLLHELESAGIPVRVLKGIPVAQTVFGDLSLRSVGDLDLLISEDHIVAADRVLRAAGYRGLFNVEGFTPRRLAFYRTHWKDIAYSNPDSGSEVDLHWRCFRNSEMPGADLCAASSSTQVHFGSFEVSTLPRTETLLYLCVHGTLDGWVYLKSLADIGASVRLLSAIKLDQLAEAATRYGVLPEVTAALLLARRYFGMEHWSALLLPETDTTVAHILRFAQRSLEGDNFLGGREAVSPASMMAFELGLRRDVCYRRELLLRVLFRARMWDTIPLPDFLFGIYPLLSPVEWVIFRLRQWLSKQPSGAGLAV